MNKRVLVTGIGGVVGQGILRNISSLSLGLEIIGVNINPVSAGNYMCNHVYVVPYAYDPDYIGEMKRVCKTENIDLIIPSTDYEAFYLAKNLDEFSCPIAASPAETTKFCLDKYLNYLAFEKYNIPFATSYLPSDYNKQYENCIVKPREGRGSRNIFVNPPDYQQFDDTYVVQELLDGPEITTTFYIKKDGSLHGFITFLRELELGNTAKAEVVTKYDGELESLINVMRQHYKFRGSCNIQSKVTENGIIPFEINCRISGTNSVRAQFGFEDVKYTIQEYMLMEEPDKPRIIYGSALRVILDIIYPGKTLDEIENKQDKFYIN